MERNAFFGGSPGAVIVRLILLSIVVGIVLSAFDITPYNILDRLNVLAKRLYDMGFGAVEWALGYFILGAIVVIPIWFVTRLLALGRRADGPPPSA